MLKRVLVVSDTHLPYEHPNYLDFCKRIYDDLKCTHVVHIGDLVDNHSISYHEHDPDLKSHKEEMKEVDRKLVGWFKVFPKVFLCLGNHDRMVDRKSKTVGLSERVFKHFEDIWNLPKSWKVGFYHIIDGVKYMHGTGYSGSFAHLKAAHDNRMNVVIGHLHSSCGIEYSANEKDCIWGMQVGCGIDRKSAAYAYGRDFKSKPIISCGVVEYTKWGANPRLFKMDMN